MHLSPGRAALLAALGLAALIPTMACAQTQDLYVTNFGNKTVSRFAATGPGMFSTTATALTDPSLDHQPSGLAFDTGGDLFVANYTNGGGSIVEFAAGTAPGTFGAASSFTDPSLRGPLDLTFDAYGDLFAADFPGNSLTEFLAGPTPGTFGAVTTITGGVNTPVCAAFDANGDLFVSNQNSNSLTEFLAGPTPGTFGAASTITGSGLSAPQGMVFDAHGDLFVANVSGGSNQSGTITEFPAGATPGVFGPAVTLIGGLAGPVGLAFDAKGDLYVANNYNGTIRKFVAIPGLNGALGTFGPAQTVETGLPGAISLAFGPSAVPVLVSLSFPSPVPGGTVVSATVTLSGPAQADVVVGLSSSDSSVVRLHRAVIILAGSSSATFPINTFRSHVTQAVTIMASLNGVVKTVPLSITGR